MNERDTGSASEQEAQWIRQIADGDRRAFEKLYEVYGPRIFRFAIRMVKDEGKAEEVVDDVMFEVWKSAGRFEARSKPSTWILGIARFRALNAIRGKKLDTRGIDDDTPIADPAEDAGEQLDRLTLAEQIKGALNDLSPEHREVVELTFFQGCSYKEIADIAGCPEGTVKTRMYHAKRKLQPILSAAVAGGSP
ncbi:MAG: sigma-70 family RNA polymerase sigma factor [Deltaproteobacteria bacterium]|nr:sigma-70 family RNA polymerase sigma factor [Deltaproteobacteria bacterium]MBW2396150.1 sigma-70 family RNA polymerase sigma factor [Deltaproteobacteria bacterium]